MHLSPRNPNYFLGPTELRGVSIQLTLDIRNTQGPTILSLPFITQKISIDFYKWDRGKCLSYPIVPLDHSDLKNRVVDFPQLNGEIIQFCLSRLRVFSIISLFSICFSHSYFRYHVQETGLIPFIKIHKTRMQSSRRFCEELRFCTFFVVNVVLLLKCFTINVSVDQNCLSEQSNICVSSYGELFRHHSIRESVENYFKNEGSLLLYQLKSLQVLRNIYIFGDVK